MLDFLLFQAWSAICKVGPFSDESTEEPFVELSSTQSTIPLPY